MTDPTATRPASAAASQLALQQPQDPSPPTTAQTAPTVETAPTAPEAAAPAAAPAETKAEKPKADKSRAAKPKAQPAGRRPRRGPPADGAPETRIVAIASTSKMFDAHGVRIRRGAAVSVPERRFTALLTAGRIRKGSDGELETARRRLGEFTVG